METASQTDPPNCRCMEMQSRVHAVVGFVVGRSIDRTHDQGIAISHILLQTRCRFDSATERARSVVRWLTAGRLAGRSAHWVIIDNCREYVLTDAALQPLRDGIQFLCTVLRCTLIVVWCGYRPLYTGLPKKVNNCRIIKTNRIICFKACYSD